MTVDVIAHIRTDLTDKFGVPRQSGLVPELGGTIVLEPPYRNPDALRGLEGFSHLWLIFQFHRAVRAEWSPTVRPPRLGGNRRMGVFATRSPFRPNAIGLSCVKLEEVRLDEKLGPVLYVSGADLVDGTPILDIKPYLPYADCHPEATGGFTDPLSAQKLEVSCDPALLAGLPPSGRHCWAFWPATPGPGIRMTRNGCTACPSPVKMLDLPWKRVCSRCWRWSEQDAFLSVCPCEDMKSR